MQPTINKQRVYDAMLIKGFRKDVTMGMSLNVSHHRLTYAPVYL
jgi:hypothetical protein